MKQSKTVAAALLAVSLAACGGDNSNSPAPADPAAPTLPAPATPAPGETTPAPVAEVYIDESFEGLSALPAGWTTLAANRGTVSVRGGSLYIDGRAHDSQMTAVALPAALQALGNYRIDVQFTLESPNNSGRWGSVMYRTSAVSSAIPHEPYYQFAVRADATTANGTEFALRKDGAWAVAGTKAFSEAIDPAKTYTATVIVHGNRVRQYLNNTLMHDMTLDAAMAKGGIGLQTAGAIMRVDSIKVTQQLAALPDVSKVIAVQDTGTRAAMAPTLVQSMTAQTQLAGSGASNALFHIDASLNLRSASGDSLASLAHYFAQTDRATVAVLRIADAATVTALAAFAVNNDLGDVTLLSDNVELLARARAAIPAVRTAVDFSGVDLGNTSQDILQVVGATNRAKAKIAVLPPSMTNRATVAHLQRLLITPWASSTATDAAAAAEVLTTGVNGVVTADASLYSAVLKKLPAGTLLRKPLVIGHRGMPGDRAHVTGQFADENTLEGARAAAAAGADGIENDIYMTVDKHLVIMHDTTVERTTDGGKRRIEDMTLAEVKALKTRPGGYAVPTLQEFFAEFRGRNISHIVELKSTTAGIVPLLKQELEKAGVKDQVVAISFSGDQLNRMTATLPEISTGFLNSNVDSGDVGVSLRHILNGTQLYSSTYNPSYANGPKQATMEAAKHRGITFWPWTVNSPNDFYRFYSYGTHGITTDHAYLAKDFPVAVSTAPAALAMARSAFSVPLTLTSQVGATRAATSNQLVVLDGAPAHSVAADGSVTFTATGTATMLPGYSHKMGDGTYSYTIFGKPMTITVR